MKGTKRRPRPILSERMGPFPIELHLFTTRAGFASAVNCYKPSERMSPRDLKSDSGACSCFGDHIVVGVFSRDLGTLVHELTHALNHACDHIELPRGFGQDEASAYLMQHMFRLCAPHVVTE